MTQPREDRAAISRRQTTEVRVGSIGIGGENPIRVQSMTDTRTSDVDKTTGQILALHREGSELVRLAVKSPEDARNVPEIRTRLNDTDDGSDLPLIGDFHMNGHQLLSDFPRCAEALDKFRVNPGNVGVNTAYKRNFKTILRVARDLGKPIRIGANWGSIDKDLRARWLNQRGERTIDEIFAEALIESLKTSVSFALEECSFPKDKLILSAKVSDVPTLISLHRRLAAIELFHQIPLHLGLTEAGTGDKGIISSVAAMSILLQEGIGDTVRVSITPKLTADGAKDPRLQEVRVCQQLLQSLGLRAFFPEVRSCPGCGRTDRDLHRSLVHEIGEFVQDHAIAWRNACPPCKGMVIAVMGCVVNGRQEASHADIGISLPGAEDDCANHPELFSNGESLGFLTGDAPGKQFKERICAFLCNELGCDRCTLEGCEAPNDSGCDV